MPGVRRGKPAHLDVVPHEMPGPRERMGAPLEELLLGIPAWTPAQHAADIEILPDDVADHVGRGHTLARRLVVGAAGRMDMVIAGIPVPFREVDPPP